MNKIFKVAIFSYNFSVFPFNISYILINFLWSSIKYFCKCLIVKLANSIRLAQTMETQHTRHVKRALSLFSIGT